MESFIVRLSGWVGVVMASGLEEARYNATKVARLLNARVLWVGKEAAK